MAFFEFKSAFLINILISFIVFKYYKLPIKFRYLIKLFYNFVFNITILQGMQNDVEDYPNFGNIIYLYEKYYFELISFIFFICLLVSGKIYLYLIKY